MLKQVLVSQALPKEHHRPNPPTATDVSGVAAAKPTPVRQSHSLMFLSLLLSLSLSLSLRLCSSDFPLRISLYLSLSSISWTSCRSPPPPPDDGGGGAFIH
ncbi:hypothetical protein Hanom_Chr15g01405291 [Helianthus anomalus]